VSFQVRPGETNGVSLSPLQGRPSGGAGNFVALCVKTGNDKLDGLKLSGCSTK